MNSQQAYNQLRDQTNTWVASLTPPKYLEQLKKPKKDDVKIIRDAVSGYQILEPHEYLIIDHPVFQRLRYIHQTALTYLVYPTANHTRFDHSLGCAKIAQRIGDRIIPKNDEVRIKELRIAALLHDIGHTFFSHLSETMIETHFKEYYDKLKEANEFKGLKLKFSEMMSYLIFKSESFNLFLSQVTHQYYPNFDLDNVGKLIKHNPSDTFAYMGDTISGPFDVDKLDYLVRDCYFTGIRADVDVERVIFSSAILDQDRFPESKPEWRRRSLVLLSGGVSVLEQITFNKMMLYPAIYHHHKVRAIECMIKSIFEIIWGPGTIKNDRLKFQDILDFYKLTEFEFFSLANKEPSLKKTIQKIQNRDLLERCLVLSASYANNPIGWKHLAKRHYEDDPKQINLLRRYIYDELDPSVRKKIEFHDLWVDIPKPPPLGDSDKALVDIGTNELVPLTKFFPYPLWISSYQTTKLKGHVFSICDSDTRGEVNRASRKVLENKFNLRLKDRATLECKF